MHVKWIKPMFGFGHSRIMGASTSAMAALTSMGAELAGTDDVVAVYITQNAPASFGAELYRGYVAGFVRLAPIRTGETVRDYPEDDIPAEADRWEIGWPVADWLLYPEQSLRLGSLTENLCGTEAWQALRTSFQGGRPIRIAEGRYQRLGDSLTRFLERNGHKLRREGPN